MYDNSDTVVYDGMANLIVGKFAKSGRGVLFRDSFAYYKQGLLGIIFSRVSKLYEREAEITIPITSITNVAQVKYGLNEDVLEIKTAGGETYKFSVIKCVKWIQAFSAIMKPAGATENQQGEGQAHSSNIASQKGMSAMRTAHEMYQFCIDNGFGQGQNKKWGVKHFSLIEQSLAPDEEILMCFIGLHNFVSISTHNNNYAYAITNKRMIMAQKKIIGAEFHTVFLDNINDISFSTGVVFGVITVDTIKERFNIALDKTQAANINNAIHDLLCSLAHNNTNEPANFSSDPAIELRKYKELLDDNIITQEDYDAKKKQLLGI